MTGMIECRYYGRDFTADEMALLRALIAADPQPTRAALSREFCRRIGWFKPDGGLKDMMARVAMLAMHRDGVIALPPPKGRQYRPKPIVFGPETEPPLFPPPTTLDEVRTLEMRTVVRGTREGRLWNEFVARYHYLGYRTLVGAQMPCPSDEGVARGKLPRGGGEAEHGEWPAVSVMDGIAHLGADQGLVSEIVVAGDELVPELALPGAAHDGAQVERTDLVEGRRGREQRRFGVRPERRSARAGSAVPAAPAGRSGRPCAWPAWRPWPSCP